MATKTLEIEVIYTDTDEGTYHPYGATVAEERIREVEILELSIENTLYSRGHPLFDAVEQFICENPDVGEVEDAL